MINLHLFDEPLKAIEIERRKVVLVLREMYPVDDDGVPDYPEIYILDEICADDDSFEHCTVDELRKVLLLLEKWTGFLK